MNPAYIKRVPRRPRLPYVGAVDTKSSNHGEGHHGFHGLFVGLTFKQKYGVSGGPTARAHHLPSSSDD